MINGPVCDINSFVSSINRLKRLFQNGEILQLFHFRVFPFLYFSSLFLYLALLFCDLTIHQYLSVLFILKVHLIHEL